MALELDPNYVFRDFVTDRVPSSGKWDPHKPEIRRLLTEWWQTLIALVGDATGLELPNLLINMSVTGGDQNNIEAEANLPVPSGPGLALFSILAEEANTGPVRVNRKPLLTNSGNDLPAGGLVEGGLYLFLDNGDSYRLMSDYASAALVAAAEQAVLDAEAQVTLASDAADRSEAARDIAAGYASDAVSQGNVPIYATATGMADLSVPEGINAVRVNGYAAAGDGGEALYKRVDTEPAHAGKVQLPDGSWLELAQDRVRPEMFGAKGDSVLPGVPGTNDATAILNWLTFASMTGAVAEGNPKATYRIATQIEVPRTPSMAALTVDLNGAKIIFDDAGILIGPSADIPFLNTTLAVDAARGDSKLNLTSVAGLEAGDLIVVESPAIMAASQPVRHTYIASETEGNQVWIEGTVVADITTQQIIDSGTSGPIVVKAFKLAKPFRLRSGGVSVNDPNGLRTAIRVRFHSHFFHEDMVFEGHTRNQIYAIYCGHVVSKNPHFKNMGYNTKDTDYTSLPSHPSGLGYGYGVITAYTYRHHVLGGWAGKGWHGVDAAVGTMYAQVQGMHFGRNAFGVNAHEGAWHVDVDGCTFIGGTGINGGRAIYLTATNNRFRDLQSHGVIYTPSMNVEVRLIDNIFDTGWLPGNLNSSVYRSNTGMAQPGALSSGRPRVFEMVGGSVSGCARVHVGLSGTGTLIFRDVTLSRGAYVIGVYVMAETFIDSIRMGDVDALYALTLNATQAEDGSVVIVNRVSKDGAFRAAGNAAIQVQGVSQIILDITNCVGDADTSLVYLASGAQAVRNLIGNTNKSGRLLSGGSTDTVVNAINNSFKEGIQAGGVVITNEKNNQVLV